MDIGTVLNRLHEQMHACPAQIDVHRSENGKDVIFVMHMADDNAACAVIENAPEKVLVDCQEYEEVDYDAKADALWLTLVCLWKLSEAVNGS